MAFATLQVLFYERLLAEIFKVERVRASWPSFYLRNVAHTMLSMQIMKNYTIHGIK